MKVFTFDFATHMSPRERTVSMIKYGYQKVEENIQNEILKDLKEVTKENKLIEQIKAFLNEADQEDKNKDQIDRVKRQLRNIALKKNLFAMKDHLNLGDTVYARFKEEFLQALQIFQSSDWTDLRPQLIKVFRLSPEDGPTKFMMTMGEKHKFRKPEKRIFLDVFN